MKKTIIVATGILLLIGACNKNEVSEDIFTASIEQCVSQNDSKIILDNTLIKWDGCEQIRITDFTGTTGGGLFDVTPQSDPTWATITRAPQSYPAPFPSGHLRAVYPAGIAIEQGKVFLPTIQGSADGALRVMPMMAETDNRNFQFKNLCGVIKIHLQQTGISIRAIKLTAGNAMSGSFSIGGNASNPTLTAETGNVKNEVVLQLSSFQDISLGYDFYIYLPPFSYENFVVTLFDNQGRICIKQSNVSNINVTRSRITTIQINNLIWESIPEGYYMIGGELIPKPNLVDLGLPSGTLWADKNIGASTITEAGDCFKFGETFPSTNGWASEYSYHVDWDRPWGYNSPNLPMLHLNPAIVNGVNYQELFDFQDAAYVNVGSEYCMPSKQQYDELFENCSYSWFENYQGTNVGGWLFTGSNNNTIFFPINDYYVYVPAVYNPHSHYTAIQYWTKTQFLYEGGSLNGTLSDYSAFYFESPVLPDGWSGSCFCNAYCIRPVGR